METSSFQQQSTSAFDYWLTSFWGFNPSNWGYLGFSEIWMRNNFIKKSPRGAIVAIYVTKHRGVPLERGRVVGFLQVGTTVGSDRDFMPGDVWVRKERDPKSAGKWTFAIRAERAWKIVPEEWESVEKLLPITYASKDPQTTGSQGAEIVENEREKISSLSVYEVPVYRQNREISGTISPLKKILSVSRALLPATIPYWVGECDGPKHLYILRLSGNIAQYLNVSETELADRMIVKVGFSLSPLSRRDQIQSAYPEGQFKWEVLYPDPIPDIAPYPNALVAIAGENGMKERLQVDGAKLLGGEFFLADEGLVRRSWIKGKIEADKMSDD